MRLVPVLQVRGSSAPAEELAYITGHSGASGVVVQDAATLDKLLAALDAHAQVPLRLLLHAHRMGPRHLTRAWAPRLPWLLAYTPSFGACMVHCLGCQGPPTTATCPLP